MSLDTDKVARYVALRAEAKSHEDAAEELKAEADLLEAELLEEFAEAGVPRMTIAGRTVYVHRQLWAKREDGVDMNQACKALVDAGHSEFVNETYNSNTVSAWLRDLAKSDTPIPPELDGVLTTSEKFTLRSTKA
jgi:hypothetical protein